MKRALILLLTAASLIIQSCTDEDILNDFEAHAGNDAPTLTVRPDGELYEIAENGADDKNLTARPDGELYPTAENGAADKDLTARPDGELYPTAENGAADKDLTARPDGEAGTSKSRKKGAETGSKR